MTTINPRYQVVPNTEDETERTDNQTQAEPEVTPDNNVSEVTPSELPPPYDPGDQECSPANDFVESPPLYSDVVKLPTYVESQSAEQHDDDEEDEAANRSFLFYFLQSNNESTNEDMTSETIGTDIGFILCFLITFIFNGIGFIIAYCSTSTYSSHYGAISGFGLSLVKLSFVAKHSTYSKDYFQGNQWLLYVLILLGWMIFLRGMFAYAQLKRYVYSSWRRSEPRDIME